MRFPRALSLLWLLLISLISADSLAATLDGTVVDDKGNPVAEATVWVAQQRQVRSVRSDAAGGFRFDKIDVAMTELVAYKEGYALGGATALVVGDATAELRLEPGDLLTLKIIDAKSKPVAGATVRSMRVADRFLVSVEDLVPHGLPAIRSGDDGILVVPHLPKEGFVKLVLSHPQYADSDVSYLPVDGEQRNILLQEGKRLAGRVTFEGNGIADARVSIFKSGLNGQKEFAEVLTDQEGFYFARVHPDRYSVAVQHTDYASPAPVGVEVPPRSEVAPVNLQLESPRYISGTVRYPDKKPCGGTRVIYRKQNVVFQDTFTNNDGDFTLCVPGGPGGITIVPPRGFQNPHVGDIPVDLGDVTRMELNPIRLESLPVIEGIIRDQDGNAPGRVLVTVQNLTVPYNVLTDEEGKIRLPLDFMPQTSVLHLGVEHQRRFQRQQIEIPLKKPDAFEVRLEAFTPDLATRSPIPGRNNLSSLVGKPAPELRGTEWVNSDPVKLGDLKDKVVVLLFWAGFDEDMGPVVLREMNVLYELLREMDDVAFLSVHDAVSSADEIRQYINNYGIQYPVLRDENEQTTFSTYGIVFIPQVVLLDKAGNVRHYQLDNRLLTCIKGLRRE